jgi:P pilus assembly chaperone PapD
MTNKQFQFPPARFNWMVRPVIGLTILAGLAGNPAHANGFLLAPTRLFFEGPARSQELTIMNQTNRTQTYRMRIEDRRLRENGEYEVITDPADPSVASSMLRLSVRQVVVPAQSSATIRVLLRKPSGLATGEVRSHLIVSELPIVAPPSLEADPSGAISIAITTVFGISIPVLVRTGATAATVSKVEAKREPVPEHPEVENVAVRLEATGNRSMFLDLSLVPARQRRGDPIMRARGVAIYSPVGARTISLGLNAEQTAKVRAGNVLLQYQEVDKDGSPVGAAKEVAF